MRRAARQRGGLLLSLGIVLLLLWAAAPSYPAERMLSVQTRWLLLPVKNGRIALRILVDRTSVEVFAGGGRVQMASCFLAGPKKPLLLEAVGGSATIRSLRVWPLRSIWQ